MQVSAGRAAGSARACESDRKLPKPKEPTRCRPAPTLNEHASLGIALIVPLPPRLYVGVRQPEAQVSYKPPAAYVQADTLHHPGL